MAPSLKSIALRLLPAGVYTRLAASAIGKRLARGVIWSALGAVTSRILALTGMILLARVVGQTQFGEFGMVQATLGVAGMLAGFDLGSTATRFVAQYGRSDMARAGRIIALVNLASWCLIIATAIVLVLSAGSIARWVLNADHLEPAIIAGSLLMVANTMRGVQAGTLAGMERFDVIAKLNVLEGVASLIGLIGFAWHFGVEGGLLGLALGTFVTWFAGRYALRRVLRDQNVSVTAKGCWQEAGILTRFSLPSFLGGLMATPVLWYCMTLVAGQTNGYDELALFSAAYQWHGPLIFLPMIVLSVSAPVLTQQWEQGDLLRFRTMLFWNAGFMLVVSVLPILIIAVLSQWIMGWYGSGFREGWPLLVLLVCAAPLHSMAKLGAVALFGMHRAWSVFSVNLMWGATMLPLSLILVPSWGSLGLAMSFVVAYLLSMFLMTGWVFRHYYVARLPHSRNNS